MRRPSRSAPRDGAGRHPLRGLLAALGLAGLGACVTPAPYTAPPVPLPARYHAQQETPRPNPTTGSAELAQWWHQLGSAELDRLVDRALANNPDLRVALARIVQAKARADQVGAGKDPTLSLPLTVADQAPGGASVGTAPAGDSGGGSSSGSQKTFQAALRADWRVDLWGEQRALTASADFQLWKAVYERENVQRKLIASVASSYVEYLSLNDRLKTAVETEKILAATLDTVEKRVAAGDATLAELEQQRAAIFATRANIPALAQQRDEALNTLAGLLGTVPGDLQLTAAGLDTLAMPQIAPDLPASLLLRRPDIRVAEAQLLAADADIAVARARLLPSMDFSAQIGYSSATVSRMFRPDALFWSVVDSLAVSIFDGGRKRNEQVFSEAVYEELAESYVRTAFQAVREVESAQVAVHLADERLKAQQEAVAAAQRAWEISRKIYLIGGIDYLTLLDTQRSYTRYLDDQQKTRMEAMKSAISLVLALGGGVEPEALPDREVAPAGIAMDADDTPLEAIRVELAGLYHTDSLAPTRRDLAARFGTQFEAHTLHARLRDRIVEGRAGPQAWYQLYVTQFASPQAAKEWCRALMRDQQRCKVVAPETGADTAPPATPAADADPTAPRLITTPALDHANLSAESARE